MVQQSRALELGRERALDEQKAVHPGRNVVDLFLFRQRSDVVGEGGNDQIPLCNAAVRRGERERCVNIWPLDIAPLVEITHAFV